MLRESFDLINDRLEWSLSGTSTASVGIPSADESSAPWPRTYVSSGSSSSSSPVPPSTNNNESSTTSSSVESSDQEDVDITVKVGIDHNAIDRNRNLIEEKGSRKIDVASSTDNETDETAESSHDDQNIHDTEGSEGSHSEDDEGESGDESEGEEAFVDDAYIQTDEVTLSASDLERLRSLRPHGGGMVTTIRSTKRTALCMEASDTVHEKEAFNNDINKGKQPRLVLDIEQMLAAQNHQQASSRRRPSASRSA